MVPDSVAGCTSAMFLRLVPLIAALACQSSLASSVGDPTAVPAAAPSCAGSLCLDDAVYQLAPAASLNHARLFDGGTRYGELLQLGNFGLGALSPLEGEVIIVDGVVFHADENGQVRTLPLTATTSFAIIKRFVPEHRIALPSVSDHGQLMAALDEALVSPNRLYAVRIDGVFDDMQLRSVARQSPPYPALEEVIATQRTFQAQDIEGTLVGFRFPVYLGPVNAPGWHFHFVSADRRWGGHVLDLAAQGLSADLDQAGSLHLMLPDDAGFNAADFDDLESGGEGFRRAIRGR